MKAWELIEQNGWRQFPDGLYTTKGYCVAQAIYRTYRDQPVPYDFHAMQTRVLRALHLTRVKELYTWNDTPERTAQDVITLLKRLDI